MTYALLGAVGAFVVYAITVSFVVFWKYRFPDNGCDGCDWCHVCEEPLCNICGWCPVCDEQTFDGVLYMGVQCTCPEE